MLTKRDAEKIQLSMANELNASSQSVVACALMLLMLFALCWFGAVEVDATTLVVVERTR